MIGNGWSLLATGSSFCRGGRVEAESWDSWLHDLDAIVMSKALHVRTVPISSQPPSAYRKVLHFPKWCDRFCDRDDARHVLCVAVESERIELTSFRRHFRPSTCRQGKIRSSSHSLVDFTTSLPPRGTRSRPIGNKWPLIMAMASSCWCPHGNINAFTGLSSGLQPLPDSRQASTMSVHSETLSTSSVV